MNKTQIRKKVHPLADITQKAGKITFVHNGKQECYYSAVNEYSGDRLSAFSNNPPSIGNSLSEVKAIFNAIRKKGKVVSCIGDF
jgi:hypothetical protein